MMDGEPVTLIIDEGISQSHVFSCHLNHVALYFYLPIRITIYAKTTSKTPRNYLTQEMNKI